MPTIRENKSTRRPGQHAPAERAAFNAPGRELPADVHPEVARFFGLLSGTLYQHRPEGVEAVIAYTPVSWRLQPSEVNLYTFVREGRWAERKWNVLEPMAEAVGDAMMKTDIVPVIDPVLPDMWQSAAERRSKAFRHIGARGVLLYDAQRTDDAQHTGAHGDGQAA